MPYFAVYAPDYTDEDAVNRRLAVREAHLANAAKNSGLSASSLLCSREKRS